MRRLLILLPFLGLSVPAGAGRRASREEARQEAADPYAARPRRNAPAADKLAWAARVVGEMEVGARSLATSAQAAREAGRDAEAACLDEQRSWLLALREAGRVLQGDLADALARGQARRADRATVRLATTLATFRDGLADAVRCRTSEARVAEGVRVTVGLSAEREREKR